jgi:hypothetical protein
MADKLIGVDCQFERDGTVRVRRILVDGRWLAVDQGRQWVDRLGRHVLVMGPDGRAQEICLRPDTMTWEMRPAGGGYQTQVV